jgi:hypothetical protein
MLPIKNLFGFRKNKGLDKSIIQKKPYRNNIDLNKRQFIKKGLLGMAGLGGLALASKVAKAGGLVFNDGSTQAAGSLEGTSIKSTSETGGTKFLREDGDGTSSWQAAGGGSEDIICHGFEITAALDGANFTVNAGKLYHGSTKCDVTADTTLTFATAGDWHDAATDDYSGGTGWCYVGVNSSGDVKLCGANAPDVTDTSGNSAGKLIYWNNGGTYWFIVGAIRVNTSNESAVLMKGSNRSQLKEEQSALLAGGGSQWTSVDLSTLIPVGATAIFGNVKLINSYGGLSDNVHAYVASGSSGEGEQRIQEGYGTGYTATSYYTAMAFDIPVITAQTMYYGTGNDTCDIYITGWEY